MKLHPLSVPYRVLTRGASVAAGLLFSGTAVSGGMAWLTFGAVAAVSVLGFLAAGLWELTYYRRFEYELTADSLDIASGVVSRRNREIPLRRIQNVDIRRNVLQRALGIAVVNLETAGGGETEASLRFVGYDEAKRLQREVQRRKRGERAGEETGEPVEATDVEVLFELSQDELLVLSGLSLDPRILSVLVFAGPVLGSFVPTEFVSSLAGFTLLLVLVAGVLLVGVAVWLTGAAVTFARYYGFRLTRHEDELRYERGLLQRYDGSIPLDKIQAVTLQENVLKRYFGYATLAIETAGYGGGQTPSGGSEAAVPLANRGRVLELARSIEEFDVDVPVIERPPKRARRRYAMRYALALGALTVALYGVDAFTGLVGLWFTPLSLVVLAPVAAHLKWRHRGYALADEHVVTRNGFWSRSTKVVPFYRVQTVIQRETIFQRRWGLASVVVDTAGSLSLTRRQAAAVDFDANDAERLRETVHDRLQVELARRRSTTKAEPRE
ncbi:PH domain-containing protein [Halobacteriaceae archaeon GCM10025711]